MRGLPAGNRDAPAHCPLVCRLVHRCVAPPGISMEPAREANRQRNGHAAVHTSVGNGGFTNGGGSSLCVAHLKNRIVAGTERPQPSCAPGCGPRLSLVFVSWPRLYPIFLP